MVDRLAACPTAASTMTFAQVLFILLGLALAFWILGDSGHYWVAMLISVGVLAFGVGLFVLLQRHGLGMGCLSLLRACGIRFTFLEKREPQLQELDGTIRRFYSQHRSTFYAALAVFFLAWMMETLEVYAILYFL